MTLALPLGLLALAGEASAQLSFGGSPPSQTIALPDAPTVEMPPVDVDQLMDEDLQKPKDAPFRFGVEIPVALGIEDSGSWTTLENGARVWRLRVVSPRAWSLNLVFSRFVLPDGAELYAYGDHYADVLGSYNALNNKENGEFAIQPLPGEVLTLEYFVPAAVEDRGELRIATVVHAYRDIVSVAKSGIPLKAAGACEIDVNCPQGAAWTATRRAVARLINGGVLCTGSLVNNSANDGKQYFVTASHCGSLNNAVFQFNYQKSGCGSGTVVTNQTVQGSVQLAVDTSIDYRWVRITETIPASYAVYYPGWDRSTANPSSGITIHHPAGDVKKISFENNTLAKSGTDWWIQQWDLGVTEGGSSGCPLYNPNHKFIGQLWGGQATCSFVFNDYYGRLDSYWNAVKSFLDPGGTQPMSIPDFDPTATCGSATPYGAGCPGAFGVTPNLNLTGCFDANGSVTLTINQAAPGQQAFLWLGTAQASVPLGAGCTLLVSPIVATLGSFPLTGGGPGTGAFVFPTTLPPTTMPGTVRMQAVCTDPGAPLGFAVTRGLTVVFQ